MNRSQHPRGANVPRRVLSAAVSRRAQWTMHECESACVSGSARHRCEADDDTRACMHDRVRVGTPQSKVLLAHLWMKRRRLRRMTLTSTTTPASMLMAVMERTMSTDACSSMMREWMRIV